MKGAIIIELPSLDWDPVTDAWDFPIEELQYLLEEHEGETFVLWGDRL